MATIPMEVVESCILPKLPVKSLVRFKSVSKSWKTLIPSSKFIHLHNRHANRLLVTSINDDTLLQVHNLESPLDPPSLCPYPNKQLSSRSEDKMTIFASCKFFVLVGYSRSNEVKRLFLLNPSTLCYHRIVALEGMRQPFLSSDVKFGLYFDEANDDCKVVRIARVYSGIDVYIYSCKTNLCRLIKHNLISEQNYNYNTEFNTVECVHKNLLYTIFNSRIHLRIGCFDIQAEQWNKDILFPHNVISPNLCILDGSLCVLGRNVEEGRKFLVWVLNESGAKASWEKLMSLVPKFRPIAYRKGSRHELLCRRFYDSDHFWYDLKHKRATKADFDGRAGLQRIDHICKESLISFSWRRNESH